MRRRDRIVLATALLLLARAGSASSRSLPLFLAFDDPTEDHLQLVPIRQVNPPSGVIDVTGMVVAFDSATGKYEITVTASADDPFVGPFRINVNLFNPDTGSTAQDPSFFQDLLNDFDLSTPTTSITLGGVNPRLTAWQAGDRVAACQGASFVEFGPCLGGLGLPDGVLGFGSGVVTFTGPPPFSLVPSKGSDVFFTATASPITTTVPAMPTPALFVLGLLLLLLLLGVGFRLSSSKKADAGSS